MASHKPTKPNTNLEFAAMLAAIATGLVLVVIPEPATTLTGLGILGITFGYQATKGD